MNKSVIASLENLTQQLHEQEHLTATEIKSKQRAIVTDFERMAHEAINGIANELMKKYNLLPEIKTTRPVIGKREVSAIHVTPEVNTAMEEFVLSTMSDEAHTNAFRRNKATKATHVITSAINRPKYKELRQNGFHEGMKFTVTRAPRNGRVIAHHPRSGRNAVIHIELLKEIPVGEF